MNLSKIEKKILQQLSANGAATVQELTEAIACSLSGTQQRHAHPARCGSHPSSTT
jgi:DNA-binding Lrp family transcriptional regulator